MLRKLFKYELKSTAKLMLLVYMIMVAVTVLGCIAMAVSAAPSGDSPVKDFFIVIGITSYVLGIFALFIVTYVYMCVHFYRTMYSDRGYLTHTLPVSHHSILNVKLLVSLFWMLCSILLLLLSVLALIAAASRGAIFRTDFSYFLSEFYRTSGMHFGALMLYLLVATIFSCLLYLLMVFTSASIGQLFSQHKIAASVIAGVVLYFAEQIISTIIMVASGYVMLMNDMSTDSSTIPDFSGVFSMLLTPTVIYSVILSVIYYVVCYRITKKHINLE